MKKLVFILVAIVSFAIQSQAQGLITNRSILESSDKEKTVNMLPQNLKFYPSLAGSELTISHPKAVDFIQIHDYSGLLILECKYSDYAVDLTSLKPGQYILTVYSQGERIREKTIRVQS